MGMVAPQQRIASAFVVIFGQHGSVTQYAEERGICRQWVYREADWLQNRLADQVKKFAVCSSSFGNRPNRTPRWNNVWPSQW